MITEREMAKSGEFLREYGKQYFVVAVEALEIGRIKWSMVPIGKNGKDGIVFYLSTEQMIALCEEILNGTFEKKLAADTGSYPGAYKYTTGEDGYLHLNFGGGKMGCRIQLQDAKSKTNYLMAVSIDAIKTMARKYMLCTGMVSVAPNSYYANIIAAFEEGRAERGKHHIARTSDMEAPKTVYEQDDEPTPPAAEPTVYPNYTLTVNGPKTLKKGFYVFNCKDSDGNSASLMFRQEDAASLGWFEKFENAAATSDTTITISGEKRDNFILYKGPATK